MEEPGLSVSHITIMRWVHQYGPELDKRIRRYLKQTNDSQRFDETYAKVKSQWVYLYHTVDSKENTKDFYLSKARNHKTTNRLFKKSLQSFHNSEPRVVTVDKNLVYPIAVEEDIYLLSSTIGRYCGINLRFLNNYILTPVLNLERGYAYSKHQNKKYLFFTFNGLFIR